jgi:hypothetical protein
MMSTEVRTPAVRPPVQNLLDSGNIVETGDDEWENGVKFTPKGCYTIEGACATCDIDQSNEEPQECHPFVEFKPYLLDLGLLYPTADRFDIKALGRDTLDIGSSSRLERLIWAGSEAQDDQADCDNNPYLSAGTSLGATLGVKAALGSIMAALVDAEDHTGAQGTIHMSPRLTTELEGVIKVDGDGNVRTVIGNHLVIIGNYPSTHIAAHIGEIDVYLGEPYLTEAPDEIRRANVQTFRIQRLALAAWNTCAAFVQPVTLNDGLGGIDGGAP